MKILVESYSMIAFGIESVVVWESSASKMMPRIPKFWEGHNSLITYSNWANKGSIDIYAKNKC